VQAKDICGAVTATFYSEILRCGAMCEQGLQTQRIMRITILVFATSLLDTHVQVQILPV